MLCLQLVITNTTPPLCTLGWFVLIYTFIFGNSLLARFCKTALSFKPTMHIWNPSISQMFINCPPTGSPCLPNARFFMRILCIYPCVCVYPPWSSIKIDPCSAQHLSPSHPPPKCQSEEKPMHSCRHIPHTLVIPQRFFSFFPHFFCI